MKIVVKSGKFCISLRLPLRLIKSKFARQSILKVCASKIDDDLPQSSGNSLEKEYREETSLPLSKAQAELTYEILRDYVKRHGHFTMTEVKSSDGDIFKIIV